MYGKLVMSEDEMRAQAAVAKTAANIYGPKVVGVTADEAIAQAKAEQVAPAPPTYTEEQVVALLEETPALFADLMASELARPEGPREMAATALLVAAEQTGQPSDVITSLETLVGSFGASGASA